MSRYEADDGGRRSRRDRDYSPDYHSGGGGGVRSFDPNYENQPPPPPPPQQQPQQQPRGLNEDYYRESAATLGVPTQNNPRPRSVPPPSSAMVRRPRSPSRSSRSSSRSYRGRGFDDDDRSRSRGVSRGADPMSRARGIVHDNFSHSATGIGVGILGAVVGGIVANKASEAAFKHRHKTSGRGRRHSDEAAPRMVSTILGAVAGGLGANAIANKVEDSRDRGRQRQLAWEGRYGPEEDLPHYDSGRPGDLDHKNGRGRLYRGDDDDYDYVYDDDRRSSRSGKRRRDEEAGFRYRF
ncbi:hypothetical protein JDV02_002677 [Purpureocillium takamizusanense]|uniref:Glycine zipper 2TM domain-containing protein n=1 Tax=Purpureocillium takamizusanense TaxID=2060973 RepID=A0A9Q8V8X2_9HYPO|nr:uncharacterized protein JDV02_002677 [Purpureocillium takamizusanense]UNI16217.1 hypothetical protein JDV02_002677 [Purpureocillium takamizusanense]